MRSKQKQLNQNIKFLQLNNKQQTNFKLMKITTTKSKQPNDCKVRLQFFYSNNKNL